MTTCMSIMNAETVTVKEKPSEAGVTEAALWVPEVQPGRAPTAAETVWESVSYVMVQVFAKRQNQIQAEMQAA